MELKSINERLNDKKITLVEKCQRKIHINLIKQIHFKKNLKMLSFSCGDGIWDYLSVKHNKNIKTIIATDIVDNPVKKGDEILLNTLTNWSFIKIQPDIDLPFNDNEFDIIIHHDVLEHTYKPYKVLLEQYRILKKNGFIIFSTPNLLRPTNTMKLLLGKLQFPVKLGSNKKIGDYIHVQEFYEQQINIMLQEIGFHLITIKHSFFGIHFLNLSFSNFPKSNLGKGLSHYLTFFAQK